MSGHSSRRESKAITDTPGGTRKRLDFDMIHIMNPWSAMEKFNHEETGEAQKMLIEFDQMIHNEKLLANTRKRKSVNSSERVVKKELINNKNKQAEDGMQKKHEIPQDEKVKKSTAEEETSQKSGKSKAHGSSVDCPEKSMTHLRKTRTKAANKVPAKPALDPTTSEEEISESRPRPMAHHKKTTKADKRNDKAVIVKIKATENQPETTNTGTKKKVIPKQCQLKRSNVAKKTATNAEKNIQPMQAQVFSSRQSENVVASTDNRVMKPKIVTKIPANKVIKNVQPQSPIAAVRKSQRLTQVSATRRSTSSIITSQMPASTASQVRRKSHSNFHSFKANNSEGHVIDNTKDTGNINVNKVIEQKENKSQEKLMFDKMSLNSIIENKQRIDDNNVKPEETECCSTETKSIDSQKSKADSTKMKDNNVNPKKKSVPPRMSRHQKKKDEKLAKAFQKLAIGFVKVAQQMGYIESSSSSDDSFTDDSASSSEHETSCSCSSCCDSSSSYYGTSDCSCSSCCTSDDTTLILHHSSDSSSDTDE